MKILYFASPEKPEEIFAEPYKFGWLFQNMERALAYADGKDVWLYLLLAEKKTKTKRSDMAIATQPSAHIKEVFKENFPEAIKFSYLLQELHVVWPDSCPVYLGAVFLTWSMENGSFNVSEHFIFNSGAELSPETQLMLDKKKAELTKQIWLKPGLKDEEMFRNIPVRNLRLHTQRVAFFMSDTNPSSSLKTIMAGTFDAEIKNMAYKLMPEIIELKTKSSQSDFFTTPGIYNDGFSLKEGPIRLPDPALLFDYEKDFIDTLIWQAKEHIRIIIIKEENKVRQIYMVSTLSRCSCEALSSLFKKSGLNFTNLDESGYDFLIVSDKQKLSTVTTKLKEEVTVSADEMANSVFSLRSKIR